MASSSPLRFGGHSAVGWAAAVAILVLAACGTAAPAVPQVTPTDLQATPTLQPTPQETAAPADTPEPVGLPLSEPGPYAVGKVNVELTDASRPERLVGIAVWYPAVSPEGAEPPSLLGGTRREPEFSDAPYPMILSSAKVGFALAPYLVTHGFVWVGVTRIDTYPQMNAESYQQPLDLLFALDQVAASPPEGLAGMIDADRTGVTGYSFDGYNTLTLSGARIDPQHYLAQCPEPDPITEAILSAISAFDCGPAEAWDEFTAEAPEAVTSSEDGLWQPMTDARIRAVMPLAGEGWWLFGERGLASVDRPILMIVATEDELYPENVLIFEHLGTPEKALISFIGQDHLMIYNIDMRARLAHFAAAFFGYHLQGQVELARFYSEAFVGQHDELAWGLNSDD